MKLRIIASYSFKMVEGPMVLKPRKVADYVCDEVVSDTYVRKEGNREKKNCDNNFYVIDHCYRVSHRLPRTIEYKITTP